MKKKIYHYGPSGLSSEISVRPLPFAQFYSLSPDPTLVTNKEGIIVYVNPAWERHTGYSGKEVLGRNPRFLGSEKTSREIYVKLWKALSEGKPFITENVVDKKKDGTEYQIRSKFYPIQINKKNVNYVQVMQDITQQKQYEKTRRAFLSMAGHELKTPITTLKLLTQVLKKSVLRRDKKNTDIVVLDRELDRMTELIDQMLDISRLETGKMVISPKYVNITQLLKTTIKKMQLLSEKHFIKFTNSNEYIVIADEYRIEQVLTNLLINAVKYSENETQILVATKKKGKKIIISVHDKGQGIPPKKLPYIFNQFYQVNDTGSKGFGLGLYISNEIIKAHKEKLWVESKVGKGSTFYFSLPLSSED